MSVAPPHQKEGAYYYRSDGVRITHDPFAPGMVEKYGAPGDTDHEGFDPYADTVGPGIYGGRVVRDEATGNVVVGEQYQNHNMRPGPVYAGGGYAAVVAALRSTDGDPEGGSELVKLLGRYPDLANDVTTGGAQPLHMCGMGRTNELATRILLGRGADAEALDTYGMTPLQRMASNNLAVAARILLEEGGADPDNPGGCGVAPMEIARQSRAEAVAEVIRQYKETRAFAAADFAMNRRNGQSLVGAVQVLNAGVAALNGHYQVRAATDVPKMFAAVCEQQGWDTTEMWGRLNRGKDWFSHTKNGSYIYHNSSDSRWWMDGPDGLGVYVAEKASPNSPPGNNWKALKNYEVGDNNSLPTLLLEHQGVV